MISNGDTAGERSPWTTPNTELEPTTRETIERRAAAAERARLHEWLGMVVHELKNPLAGISGMAQLMERRRAYDQRAVRAIIERGRHLERLIGDLLDLARLEAGHMALRRTVVDVAAIVRTAATTAQATTRQHRLVVATPEHPVLGWWDGDRLAQILANLLTNAIKYSPRGGQIALCVEDHGESVQIVVADQGVGIPAADLPHLFDRFYRAAQAQRGEAAGLGLGLAICQGLVEAHGGAIAVESAPGVGSTFTITLPRDRSLSEQ